MGSSWKAVPLRIGVLVALAGLGVVAGVAQGTAPAAATAQRSGVEDAVATSDSLSYGTPGVRVIVPEETLIQVITEQPLTTNKSKVGTAVSFMVSEDVAVNRVLVIPRGAKVHGEVVEDKKAGRLSGSPALTVKLDSMELGGESYTLYAYEFRVEGTSKTRPTREMVGGAEIGALAGAVVSARSGGGPTVAKNAVDMSAGAAAGAGVVAATAAMAPRPVVTLPAESEMDFYLAAPISVQPLSKKEAEQLSQRVHPGGPVLYVRGERP